MRKDFRLRTDHVPAPPDCVQELATSLERGHLGAQPRDMNVDDVRLGVEVIFPDIFQQHRAGHDLPRVAHQILEETKLARLKLDRRARSLSGPGQQIKLEVADGDFGFHGAGITPSNERVHAREQFGEGAGLRQVVVATGPQSLDPVVDIGKRTEEQDRCRVALLAHRAHELDPIELRQHAVNHRNVVRA